MDDAKNPLRVRRKRPLRKIIPGVAVALLIALALVLTLQYLLMTSFRERHVSYEYTVIIEPDVSGRFSVVCSLPASYDGSVDPDVLSSVVVEGNVTISKATSPYGDGLEIAGTGSAVITWSHHYTYRTSTQSIYDHYSNLSMLDIGYARGNAFVYLEGANSSFSLSYHYSHVYGNVGADFLKYEVTGNLTAGWNFLSVDFDHAVS